MYDTEMERARMRLPVDHHVPASLRAKRELTLDERKKAEADADSILLTQGFRAPRKHHHE